MIVLQGLRSLRRDLRSGELRLLMFAVVLAVTALTAVGFFADRLKAGLERDARQLLGGDVVVASDNPTPPPFVQEARRLGLDTNQSIGFPTMARATPELGGATKLVALKAVTPGYPLRGKLSVRTVRDAADQTTSDVPAPGEVWVDPALLEALGLNVGDPLLLGDAALRIARIIVIEPDRGAGFTNFAPRVMLNQADLVATALIQPASRVSYRFAVAGEASQTQAFERWAAQRVKEREVRGLRVESLQGGRPEMRQTLERAEKFLNLVALLATLLSAVAVALAARSFATRRLDDCAMLRVLGQSQRHMLLSFSVEFFVAGVVASLIGVAVGYAVHGVFVQLLGSLVGVGLPAPSLWPLAWGVGVGMCLLLAFGMPPILQLSQVSALRVIRRDLGDPKASALLVLALGVLGFAALLMLVSGDMLMGGIAVGGFALATALFAGVSWLALRALRALVSERTAPMWLVLATRQISARPGYTVVQISALAVGLLALVLLVLLRTDLVNSWRNATPPDAPNRFVINIMPDQSQAFQQALRDGGVARYDWFPMIRGRLVSVNGKGVRPEDYAEERARRLVDREFNISHSEVQPGHNRVVAGRWVAGEADGLSMEEGIAQTLGLKLGDALGFDVGGTPVEARITSLRKVDWSSMRANFFVMFPVRDMPTLAATYMSAFRAPPAAAGQAGMDAALVRTFPNVTVVDMTATVAQVQGVLEQVIRAVEFLFGFTLAAGLVVLFAAVSATREQRFRDFAVMRALGAGAPLLSRVQYAELTGVGALAGVLASVMASAVGWALARYAFEFNWTASLWVPVVGAVVGAVLALGAGWWSLREVLRRPVVQTLRSAAQ